MEIERKFLIKKLPDLSERECHLIEQGYLSTNPVVRVRRQDDTYYLTYKGGGMMAHEEYNLPLNKESYEHLIEKTDGNIISKKRYLIPVGEYTAEIDVFEGLFEGVILAEVEFASITQAEEFQVPEWFGTDVTYDGRFHNSNMSRMLIEAIEDLKGAV